MSYCKVYPSIYHARQLQYRADVRGPGDEQLCRARKFFLRPGIFFLIRMCGSPKSTFFTLWVCGFIT